MEVVVMEEAVAGKDVAEVEAEEEGIEIRIMIIPLWCQVIRVTLQMSGQIFLMLRSRKCIGSVSDWRRQEQLQRS